MSRTPVKRLTETSIDKADSLIRDAQVTLSEFEKQIERGFSWWVRFADRDYASTLAERFENYFKSAKKCAGIHRLDCGGRNGASGQNTAAEARQADAQSVQNQPPKTSQGPQGSPRGNR